MWSVPEESRSALEEAVRLVGDRWSLLVIEALLARPSRFNELQEAVPGIASNVLSQRLKHLEKHGIVVARAYSERPPRASYALTRVGRDLGGALRLLAHWGAGASGEVEPQRHVACGTPLEPRWYCPTCGRLVEDAEQQSHEELRFI